MPIHTSLLGRYAVVTAEGRYETSELRDGIDAALARFPNGPPAALLIDFSASQVLAKRAMRQIRAMAHFLVSRGDAFGGRLAMVAPTVVSFGLIRIGTVTTERGGLDSCVFRTFEEAFRWLEEKPSLSDDIGRSH